MMIKKCIIYSLGAFLISCAYENEEELFGNQNCAPNSVTFSGDIQPIIVANCALSGCHDGSNPSLPDWTVFSNVQSKAQLIKFRTGNRTMPPSNAGVQLTSDEIDAISCWVDDGALNN